MDDKMNILLNSGSTINEIIEKLKDGINILGSLLPSPDYFVTPQQKRFLEIFCCYSFRYTMYLKEISCSYNTLNFLSINSIGRSAIECYAQTKYIFLNRESNHLNLFQTLAYVDLKQFERTISNYKKDYQNKM